MALRVRRNATCSDQTTEASARVALESEIAKHADAIIELKGRLNAMAPISVLPPEVLSEIFAALAHSSYSPQGRPGFRSQSAYDWITVTHVCRAWRNIALDTPRLWSRVILSGLDITQEVIARSKRAPLWVTAYMTCLDDPRKTLLDSIMRESSRLKELDLVGPAQAFESFSTLPMGPATILETLILCEGSPYDLDDVLFPHNPSLPVLFQGQTPNLRHLLLNRIGVKWDNPIFCSTLTHLTVVVQYDANPSFSTGTFSQLLSALENMHALERLELNEAIPRLRKDLDGLPAPQCTVELPHLRELVIASGVRECADFLNHVSLPATARLRVTAATEEGVEPLVRVFSAHLARSPPLLTVSLSPLCAAQTSVLGWRTIFDEAQAREAVEPDAALYLEASRNLSALQALVREAAIFGAVRRLEIRPSATTGIWEDLFVRVPELRALSIIGQPQPGLFEALSRVHREDGPWAQNGPGRMLAGKLHTVHLKGVRFGCLPPSEHEPEYVEEMLEWLILRCNEGVPIQRLELEFAINLAADGVSRLAEVVPRVVWDGIKHFEDDEDEIEDENQDEDDDMDFVGNLYADLHDLYDEEEDEDELGFWMLPFGF